MIVFSSSTGCPAKPANAGARGDPIIGSLTFQNLITIICWAFFGVSLLLWLGLVVPHLRHYKAPNEQRQIFRIVSTPLVFAVIAVISTHVYDAADYLSPWANLYEAYALASLFLLYVQYVTPDLQTRDSFFQNLAQVSRKGEVIAGGSIQWFWKTWRTVFFYVVIYTALIIIQEITKATGVYCSTSSHLRFAHVWIQILELITTIWAVLAVVKFQRRLKVYMAGHNAFSKLLVFKLFVLISALQHFVFSILKSRMTGNSHVTYDDLTIGLPALLICVEGVIFMVGFYFTFNAREYRSCVEGKPKTYRPVQALVDALNPMDLMRGVFQAFGSFRGRK
ncbi:uncharacterized protein Z520_11452 [Fonsecaea multimorphosa CBS 102226]|uniref:Uncharacterized protein n=1 Tax=Fonsecaea multimorphosa CBS 102226 TaxID=1442371 RepID=A0A0D2JQN4_9EURO|nr:uncharacterized protein Z520_11452 [Fonsecaea multimorphosa CBS 102226]KIX92789.1 hypothetical protein Z520_11452 [Fonsecaea multimorphosa CBS 102226]OAL18037.1 hypothetical protein AYO22_11053 [Fonsecaea multimorphosa]